jgi:hypothetical protein
MSDHQSPGEDPLPLSALTELDRACSRFEAEWAAGLRPRAEDYLAAATERMRSPLLGELLRVELEARRGAGEEPTPGEYRGRFPGDAATVEAVFQVTITLPPDRDGFPEADRVGKYRVLRPLGRGGQARTYLALDPDLGRHVVLKVYHRAETPEQQEQVLKEGRAQARVRSRYLAQCYSAERLGRCVYLVIEYVPGKTLAEVIRDRTLTPAEAVRLLERLAEGLAAIHECGLLHRDLKPSNVLLGDDGVPRLIDLGLAAPMASDELHGISGTPAYMAPEQARGHGERIDARTDVFGLGAVLYELLTGRPPYLGDDPRKVLEQSRRGRLTPPGRIKPSIPPPLEQLCLKAMAGEPADRFGSAAELQTALRRYRRRPIRFGVAALLVVGLAGAVLSIRGVMGERGKASPSGSAARLEPAPSAPAWPRIEPASPQMFPPAAASSSIGVQEEGPLSGELILRIGSSGPMGKPWLPVDRDGALPVRRGESVHLQVRLNRPAYTYLLWVDSQGQIDPLYPWPRDFLSPPVEIRPADGLDSPPGLDQGWPMEGPSGLETALLLARTTPLPKTTDLARLVGRLPPAPLRDPRELAVRGFDPGQPPRSIERGLFRGLGKEAERVDEPLMQLLERLRPHFDLIRAVRFAYRAD